MSQRVDAFEAMLARGQDGALLRFSLANALIQAGREAEAVAHLRAAVEQDPGYSAAWKLLGKMLAAGGDPSAAAQAYQRGIAAAETRGDMQAAKEMRVFLRRLDR